MVCFFSFFFISSIPSSCLLSPVSCLLSPVSCLLSPVSCLLSPVSCLLSPVSCLLYPVSCLLSPVSCLLSPVSCLLSPLSTLFFFLPFCCAALVCTGLQSFPPDLVTVSGLVLICVPIQSALPVLPFWSLVSFRSALSFLLVSGLVPICVPNRSALSVQPSDLSFQPDLPCLSSPLISCSNPICLLLICSILLRSVSTLVDNVSTSIFSCQVTN